jgi:hypothetical protein
MLHNALLVTDGGNGSSGVIGNSNNAGIPSVEELATWCQRAYELLQEYEWMNWYSMPID